MNHSIVYGCKNKSLLEARSDVERCLGITLEERESDYHGGLYYSHKYESGWSLMLKMNIDLYDDEPAEQGFPDFAVLLYLNSMEDLRPIAQLLPSHFQLLRQKHQQ